MKYEKTINVKGMALGRAASRAAILLMDKDSPEFQPNRKSSLPLRVKNVSKIRLSGNKLKDKRYKRYSGYPGGLKFVPAEKIFKESPDKVFKNAVLGMLPKNKLRNKLIKRLIFKD